MLKTKPEKAEIKGFILGFLLGLGIMLWIIGANIFRY